MVFFTKSITSVKIIINIVVRLRYSLCSGFNDNYKWFIENAQDVASLTGESTEKETVFPPPSFTLISIKLYYITVAVDSSTIHVISDKRV